VEERNRTFDGSIPEYYDRYLGPVLFEPYAVDLAARVRIEAATQVLELACGTGILTRRLRRRLPLTSRLLATDLNLPMIEYAQARSDGYDGIDWKQADACDLPFSDKSFEVVICQFGLMFVPDKFTALSEILRVLKVGGQFIFNVWDSLALNSLARIALETGNRLFALDPPTF